LGTANAGTSTLEIPDQADRRSYTGITVSIQYRSSAQADRFSRSGSGPGGDETPLISDHLRAETTIDSPRTTIITHEVPEAGPYPGSDAGPAFRNDNDPTATTDRLRQAWEAGAHDITMTFSDSAYQRPPAPGHVDH